MTLTLSQAQHWWATPTVPGERSHPVTTKVRKLVLLLLPILCRAASSAALSHTLVDTDRPGRLRLAESHAPSTGGLSAVTTRSFDWSMMYLFLAAVCRQGG